MVVQTSKFRGRRIGRLSGSPKGIKSKTWGGLGPGEFISRNRAHYRAFRVLSVATTYMQPACNSSLDTIWASVGEDHLCVGLGIP